LLKRVFTADEQFSVATEIAHFGERPLVDAQAYGKLADMAGKVVAHGDFAAAPSISARILRSVRSRPTCRA
jgi:hypothetical protein